MEVYLSYIRNHRLNISDESETRQTYVKAYDFAVGHDGIRCGIWTIWSDYLDFTQSELLQISKNLLQNC